MRTAMRFADSSVNRLICAERNIIPFAASVPHIEKAAQKHTKRRERGRQRRPEISLKRGLDRLQAKRDQSDLGNDTERQSAEIMGEFRANRSEHHVHQKEWSRRRIAHNRARRECIASDEFGKSLDPPFAQSIKRCGAEQPPKPKCDHP